MKVCILGSNGFIGSNLLKCDPSWVGVTRQQLDLTVQKDVDVFFETNSFDVVVHCAVVGGSRLQEDQGSVCVKNILMFENVVRHLDNSKLIYFSSGASKKGNPPSDPYGLSKWIIDKRIETLPNVYSLCIWGCYGPGELETRFSAICKNKGHIVIPQDKYFDFVDIEKVKKVVNKYIIKGGQKFCNLVGEEKLKLSEWATKFGATFTVEKEGLGESYVSKIHFSPS
jgi:nucleoside-diphosphate-sugar epimerase